MPSVAKRGLEDRPTGYPHGLARRCHDILLSVVEEKHSCWACLCAEYLAAFGGWRKTSIATTFERGCVGRRASGVRRDFRYFGDLVSSGIGDSRSDRGAGASAGFAGLGWSVKDGRCPIRRVLVRV